MQSGSRKWGEKWGETALHRAILPKTGNDEDARNTAWLQCFVVSGPADQRICKQEVTGSIPVGSITLRRPTTGGDLPEVGRLVAWDPIEQRQMWRVDHPQPLSDGTLATAGGLVFWGRADGRLRASRATDGEVLWEFEQDAGIAAAPATYSVWSAAEVRRIQAYVLERARETVGAIDRCYRIRNIIRCPLSF